MSIPIGYVRDLKPGQKDYLITHGCIIDHGTVLVPIVCPHLKYTENLKSDFRDQDVAMGRTYCDIYEKRPQACKDFDGRPLSHGRKYFVPEGCSMVRK
jgi:hypothetical protein